MHPRIHIQRLQRLAPPQHRPAHGIPVAADVFRQRMNHEIRPQRQRTGANRRGKSPIHRHIPHPHAMRQRGAGGNVAQPHDRVGWRFQPQHARIRPDRRRNRLQIRCIHQRHLDAPARQGVPHQLRRPRIAHIRGHQMIARTQPPGQQRMGRRHARSEAARRLRPFQRRQLVLQGAQARVAHARIQIAVIIAHIQRRKPGQLVRHKGRRQHRRRRRGAADRVDALAPMHCLGRWLPAGVLLFLSRHFPRSCHDFPSVFRLPLLA